VGTFIGGGICQPCLEIIYFRPTAVERTVAFGAGRRQEVVPGIYVTSRVVLIQWTEAGKACSLWSLYEGAGASPAQAHFKLCERVKFGLDPQSGPDAAQTWLTPLR
jgi:hypothetical protein